MAQRRKPEPGGRRIRHNIMVTQAEEVVLREKAAAAGMTVASYLVYTGLDADRRNDKRIWRSQLIGLRQQLNKYEPFHDEVKATNRKVQDLLDVLQ